MEMISEKRYQLAPFFFPGFFENKLLLCDGSRRVILEDLTLQEVVLRAARLFNKPATISFVIAALEVEMPECPIETFVAGIDILKSANLIFVEGLLNESDRYLRQAGHYLWCGADPIQVRSKLQAATVSLVGCGGLGNLVAVALANAGVGTLRIFDHDKVALENLIRAPVFTEADVGQEKAEVVRRAINLRNSETVVQSYSVKVVDGENLSLLLPSDLVICAANEPLELYQKLNDFCVSNLTPLLMAGGCNDVVNFGPLVVPGFTACIRCKPFVVQHRTADPKFTELLRLSTRDHAIWSPESGAMNLIAAGLLVTEALKFLGEFSQNVSLNAKIGILTDLFGLRRIDLERNPACTVCGGVSFEADEVA
jgi:hypothetical protein